MLSMLEYISVIRLGGLQIESNVPPLITFALRLLSGALLLRIFRLHLAAERGHKSSTEDYPRSDPLLRHQMHYVHLLGEVYARNVVT